MIVWQKLSRKGYSGFMRLPCGELIDQVAQCQGKAKGFIKKTWRNKGIIVERLESK